MVESKVEWEKDYHIVLQCCCGTYWESFALEMIGAVVATTLHGLGTQVCASCVCIRKTILGILHYRLDESVLLWCIITLVRFVENGGSRKASVPTQVLALVIEELMSTKTYLDAVTRLVFKRHQGFYQT